MFPPGVFVRIKGFTTVQFKETKREQKRIKRKCQTISHVSCCTLVLLRIKLIICIKTLQAYASTSTYVHVFKRHMWHGWQTCMQMFLVIFCPCNVYIESCMLKVQCCNPYKLPFQYKPHCLQLNTLFWLQSMLLDAWTIQMPYIYIYICQGVSWLSTFFLPEGQLVVHVFFQYFRRM